MGACTTKHRSIARDLDNNLHPLLRQQAFNTTAPPRTLDVKAPETQGHQNVCGNNAWDLSSSQALPPTQICSEVRCLGIPQSFLLAPQRRRPFPVMGVRLCGLKTPTVPQSQPYLVQTFHWGLPDPGRYALQRGSECKLKITEKAPPKVEGVPGPSHRRCVSDSSGVALGGPLTECRLVDLHLEAPSHLSSSLAIAHTDNPCLDLRQATQADAAAKWPREQGWKLNTSSSWKENHVSASQPRQRAVLRPSLEVPRRQNVRRARCLCVSSISTELPEANFEDKAVQTVGANSAVSLEKIGISVVCKKGYKPCSTNNDAFFVFHVGGCTVCCVLDGHGPFGHDVCHIVQQDMIRLTTGNPALSLQPRRILRHAFLTAQHDLTTKYNELPLDSKLSGTTVTMVVYLRDQHRLVVAHVGNSRAVLCRLGKRGCAARAVDLTVDHTPSNVTELRRIVKAGGQVRVRDGDVFHRIFLMNEPLPGLALARSIGDTLAATAGVIAVPDIKEYKLDMKRDAFLLLCTDGVWNIMSSQEAVEVAYSARQRKWQTAPEELARESWRRWMDQEQIFADDITALFMEIS